MYQIQVKDNKATCYIEAIEGKEFKIQNKMVQSFQPQIVAFFAEIDGSKVGGRLVREIEDNALFDGPYISAALRRPLIFTKINLTDDTDLASNDELFIKNLGVIKVIARRGNETGPAYTRTRFENVVDNRAVDERSKKANVSHQSGYGAAEASLKRYEVPMMYTDSKLVPYVTFEIKYLPRNLLELQDIVKPLVLLAGHDGSPSTSSSSEAKSNKKRKASDFTIDNDGALVLSDDSDHEGNPGTVKIEAGNKRLKGDTEAKVKKEKNASKVKVKKEKVVIELD